MIQKFIQGMPKVELHMHIEGSLEPELLLSLAKRNQTYLSYENVEQVKMAYQFSDLQSFLDLYYQGAAVLQTEQDFYDLAMAYFERCYQQNVVHTEIFFDPQTHTERGVTLATLFAGLVRAKNEAQQRWGISSDYILCILRHLSEAEGIECLREALVYRQHFIGIGLDSSEKGHPAQKFKQLFAFAKAEGLHLVAHAGEEAPAQAIRDTLDLLNVSRIDHGVSIVEDPQLMVELAQAQIPLTVCPFSNIKLKVFNDLSEHSLPKLIEAGLAVTINSDDPSYFGGYIEENWQACAEVFEWDQATVMRLAHNAIAASFLSAAAKQKLADQLDAYQREFSAVE